MELILSGHFKQHLVLMFFSIIKYLSSKGFIMTCFRDARGEVQRLIDTFKIAAEESTRM